MSSHPQSHNVDRSPAQIDNQPAIDRRRHTSRRVSLTELILDESEIHLTRSLISKLTNSHLVVTSRNIVTGEEEVEVAHEALIRHWPRLQQWIEVNRKFLLLRDDVRDAAWEWETGKRREGLLSHRADRLNSAQALLAQNLIPLNRVEREYLAACLAWERRSTRRQRVMIVGLVLLLLTAVIAGYLVIERNQRVRSQRIADLAKQNLNADRALSQALALAAFEIYETPAAEDALRQSLGREQAVSFLGGHSDAIASLAWSRDERLIVSAGADQIAKVWDVERDVPVSTLVGHTDVLTSAAFSPEGNLVVTSSRDKTAKIWETSSGKLIQTLNHTEPVETVHFNSQNGNEVVTASRNLPAAVWDVNTGNLKLNPAGNNQFYRVGYQPSADFSPDGQFIVGTLPDHLAGIWRSSDGSSVCMIGPNQSERVQSFDFSPDSRLIITVLEEKALQIWSVDTCRLVTTLGQIVNKTSAVYLKPAGDNILTMSDEDGIQVWNAHTGASLRSLPIETSIISAMSPSGRFLVSYNLLSPTAIWDVASAQLVRPLKLLHGTGILSLSASPHGNLVALGRGYGPKGPPSPTGIELWNRQTGEFVKYLDQKSPVKSVAFSVNSNYLATANGENCATVWDVSNGVPRLVLGESGRESGGSNYFPAAVFGSSGRYVVCSEENDVKVFSTEDGKLIRTIPQPFVLTVGVSPDERFVATATRDHGIKIWEVETGKIHYQFDLRRIAKVSFSNAGRLFMIVNQDGAIDVYESQGFKLIHKFVGHESLIIDANFSPDERFIVSAGMDGKAKVWDLAQDSLRCTLYGSQSAVSAATFSPDGRYVITASLDGTSLVFPVFEEELLRVARSRITYKMTEAELNKFESKSSQ